MVPQKETNHLKSFTTPIRVSRACMSSVLPKRTIQPKFLPRKFNLFLFVLVLTQMMGGGLIQPGVIFLQTSIAGKTLPKSASLKVLTENTAKKWHDLIWAFPFSNFFLIENNIKELHDIRVKVKKFNHHPHNFWIIS